MSYGRSSDTSDEEAVLPAAAAHASVQVAGRLMGPVRLTVFAALVSIVAIVFVWHELLDRHKAKMVQTLRFEANETAVRINERFRGYRQVLRSGRALFAASQTVTRDEWRAFAEKLDLGEDYRGIQGVGFALRITPQQRAAHIQSMRRYGFPNYRLWPAGERPMYSAIVLLEPFDWRNQRALGYDMYSEPVRREAMDRAWKTGGSALSGKVTLVQETRDDTQAGVLLYMPVYRNGFPVDTEAERDSALVGWVYSPFRMNDLMDGMLGAFSEHLRLRIFDGERATAKSLLYDSHARFGLAQSQRPASGLSQDIQLELDGRTWLLRFEGLPGFGDRDQASMEPLFVVCLVALLFVSSIWFLATTHVRAQKLAQLTESLRRSEEQYSTLLNLSREGIAATDARFHITFANPSLGELLACKVEELQGQPLERFWKTLEPPQKAAMLARLRHGFGERYEVELIRCDDKRITALVSDGPLTDAQGAFLGAIFTVADITERKEAERRIHYLATHDGLTGVPNRLAFRGEVEHAITRSRRYGHRFALMFADLDDFKLVNDTHGHQAGDAVLIETTRRMQSCLRSSDTLARLGGDEFVVLVPEIQSDMEAQVVAEKIREALLVPMHLSGGVEVTVSASIGIAIYPQDGTDLDDLVRHADEQMYGAKSERQGKSSGWRG